MDDAPPPPLPALQPLGEAERRSLAFGLQLLGFGIELAVKHPEQALRVASGLASIARALQPPAKPEPPR